MDSDLLAGLEKPLTLVTVFPHPDDESFAAGATLALYAGSPDVRRVSLCLTKGGKSGALPLVGLPEERETIVREREYYASTSILGVDEAAIWDYEDQGLSGLAKGELASRLEEFMKSRKADVVVTYGPDGITGHPDHLACSAAAAEAARAAGVKRLFMVTAPRWIGKLMLGRDLLEPTHALDIRKVYPVKMLALRSHASQMLISRKPMIWVGVVMRLLGKEYYHRFEL